MRKSLFYYLFRFSFIYRLYLRLFRKDIYKSLEAELAFYKNLNIPKKAVIFDVGANIGDKTSIFSRIAQSVVAVEPDRKNFRLLKNRFLLNGNISIKNVAVGEENSKSTFYVTNSGSPANTLSTKWKNILEDPVQNRWSKSLTFETSYEVDVMTIQSLSNIYGQPFYIKIDVEGFELEAIKGMEKPAPILSLEANLPEFKTETITCVDQLGKLSAKSTFNCIKHDHIFLWEHNKSENEMISWLNDTDLKYFEIFCFTI